MVKSVPSQGSCEHDSLTLSSYSTAVDLSADHGTFCGSNAPPNITTEGNVFMYFCCNVCLAKVWPNERSFAGCSSVRTDPWRRPDLQPHSGQVSKHLKMFIEFSYLRHSNKIANYSPLFYSLRHLPDRPAWLHQVPRLHRCRPTWPGR